MTTKTELAREILENHKTLCDLVLLMNAYPPPNQRVMTELLQQELEITEKTVELAIQLASQVVEDRVSKEKLLTWAFKKISEPHFGAPYSQCLSDLIEAIESGELEG